MHARLERSTVTLWRENRHYLRFKVLPAGAHTLNELQRWASYLINIQVVDISYLLDDLQAWVDELTALQDITQAELDALLPSVLDKAFREEL
jgi:hypothetical protein